MGTIASQLHDTVAAACPIEGVSIGDFDDRATWAFHPKPDATAAQIAAAEAALQAFVPSDDPPAAPPPAPVAQVSDVAVSYLKGQVRYELAVRAAVHGDAEAIDILKPEADRRGMSVIDLANEIQAARRATIEAILAA